MEEGNYYTLHENIRRARMVANKTPEEVAEEAGIDVGHYLDIEEGELVPTIYQLGCIAEALDHPAQELVRQPPKLRSYRFN